MSLHGIFTIVLTYSKPYHILSFLQAFVPPVVRAANASLRGGLSAKTSTGDVDVQHRDLYSSVWHTMSMEVGNGALGSGALLCMRVM